MDFLAQYGLFLVKSITVVVSLLIIFSAFFALSRKPKENLEVNSLNEYYDDLKQRLHKEVFGKKIKRPKAKKKQQDPKPTIFVIDFSGDIKATQVEQLRDEVSAILSIASPKDEVVIRLESPGGAVNAYGLAASQIQRIRDKKIPLTACIDKIAASGGYLMACVAHQIIAAPFAIIGSIGVVGQVPNFHRWLKKNNIDFELLTAGEYKRTLTIFAENTEKGRQKFQDDLEKIHQQFRNYVMTHRQDLDIEQVATGEHWLAKDAFDLRLIDHLKTSDEYLIDKMQDFNVYQVKLRGKQSLLSKCLKPAMKLVHPWA